MEEFEVGVIVARFQVHELHEAHVKLIDKVCEEHKKVIIFLGVPVIENTRHNPLDFATRRVMIQEMYPSVVVLPIRDMRCDKDWSNALDNAIPTAFGEKTAVLYGSRDSFIPYYHGKYQTRELETDTYVSGTEVRNQVSKEILSSKDFRAGIIHANYAQRPVTYMTVDIAPYDEQGRVLLARKAFEAGYRFIGGFVDIGDSSLEQAARREFREETGGCEIGELDFVMSKHVKDWRYKNIESRIMTSLFAGALRWGRIIPSDDIAELKWVSIEELVAGFDVGRLPVGIVEEHVKILISFIEYYEDLHGCFN